MDVPHVPFYHITNNQATSGKTVHMATELSWHLCTYSTAEHQTKFLQLSLPADPPKEWAAANSMLYLPHPYTVTHRVATSGTCLHETGTITHM